MNGSETTRRLVVLGSGGFGRRIPSILSDINRGQSKYKLIGFVDKRICTVIDGATPFLGSDEELASIEADYVIGIADPRIRQRLDQYALSLGKEPATLIHPAANIESPVGIDPGCIVLAGACVNANSRLDRQVLVNVNAVIGHDVHVGACATLSPLSIVCGRAKVGARVLIGAGAIVLPGISLGDDAIIGAGAVVTTLVPPGRCAVGSPARLV